MIDQERLSAIWDSALQYQDKRDDSGHARIVTAFAEILAEWVECDKQVIVLAAMLHDIGWSQLSRDDRMLIFSVERFSEEWWRVRTAHEKEGARLAASLLEEHGVQEDVIDRVTEIIDGHDTREGFLHVEDGLMRDADKLWRFSRTGMEADLRRRPQRTRSELLKRRQADIDKEGFFYSEQAKTLARNLLEETGEYPDA